MKQARTKYQGILENNQIQRSNNQAGWHAVQEIQFQDQIHSYTRREKT